MKISHYHFELDVIETGGVYTVNLTAPTHESAIQRARRHLHGISRDATDATDARLILDEDVVAHFTRDHESKRWYQHDGQV